MPKQLAFVIDLKRCIGCDTCVVGCKVENVLEDGKYRLRVYDASQDPVFERPKGSYPNLTQYWVPTMCHHCTDAPCVAACPTTALWRREGDGMVVLDQDKCVGCRRCEEDCPYDALSFDEELGKADKCNLCEHKLSGPSGANNGPSCALVCPTRAIHFGDIHDPDSRVAQLLATREHKVLNERAGAKPNIYYLEP